MATTNYNFPQYTYGTKGWDVGFNQTLQTINDRVRDVATDRASVDAQVSTNSGLLAVNTISGYVPLGYNLAFDIWQRGSSFALTTASTAVADLWWKNPASVVTKATSSTSEPGVYNCRVSKVSGSSGSAFIWNGIPFPSKFHSSMRFFKNRVITYSMYVYCATASEACIALSDGVDRTFSSFHTGGSTWQRLTVNKTLSADASELRVECWVRGSTVDAWASFTDGACAVGNYTSLSYIPRPQQENELAARMMYQQIIVGAGWGNKPSTHSEKFSVIHPVPMVKEPDAIGTAHTAVAGTMTVTCATSSRFDTVVTATGVSRPTTSPYNVSASPLSLTLDVNYCGVGFKNKTAGYSVT